MELIFIKILNLFEIRKVNKNIEVRTDEPINRDTYVQNRLNDQIKWYSNKSKKAQSCYKKIMISTFILNAAIPTILLFSDFISLVVKVFVTLITAIITILNGIIQLNNYQDIWLNYRTTCENLLREKILYETMSGKYKNVEDPLELLILTCEKIMDSETKEWVNYAYSENQSSTSS